MVEIDSNINDFVSTVFFALMEEGFINSDLKYDDVDRGLEVVSDVFKDVEEIVLTKRFRLSHNKE